MIDTDMCSIVIYANFHLVKIIWESKPDYNLSAW